MPPRKSNVSVTTTVVGDEAAKDAATPAGAPKVNQKPKAGDDEVSIEDLNLPRSIIQRISRGVLPANTIMAKDPVTAIQKASTVFISHIAHLASEHAADEGRKTIQPQDVRRAIVESEFESFLPRLDAEMKIYGDAQTAKRNEYRKKVKDADGSGASKVEVDASMISTTEKESGTEEHDDHNEREGNPSKRVKLSDGATKNLLAVNGEAQDVPENTEEAEDEKERSAYWPNGGLLEEPSTEEEDNDDEEDSDDEEGEGGPAAGVDEDVVGSDAEKEKLGDSDEDMSE